MKPLWPRRPEDVPIKTHITERELAAVFCCNQVPCKRCMDKAHQYFVAATQAAR